MDKDTGHQIHDGTKFHAFTIEDDDATSTIADKTWTTALSSRCTFSGEIFEQVMSNLIKNPNIMSSYLFRADIMYDSQTDSSTLSTETSDVLSSKFTQHMKQELRPRLLRIDGFEWQRTVVRKLVPRNRQLDNDMIQTCHFFRKTNPNSGQLTILVVYIPHIDDPEKMPWYHPSVKALGFSYESIPNEAATISILLEPFLSKPLSSLQPRMHRTCLNLLQTIHKHGRGQQAGYQKRIHHDQIISQQAWQESYAKLKERHAKRLIGDWVEQTDPTKHVFEDLGIAAFLIELWREMYGVLPKFETENITSGRRSGTESGHHRHEPDTDHEMNMNEHLTIPSDCEDQVATKTAKFPGFVDIGCGNGVLVYILISEGYQGWGFDARQRKTWEVFPAEVQANLEKLVLVPSILDSSLTQTQATALDSQTDPVNTRFHPGIFPTGTFIVSNHADELTPWTPLLAHLNKSPFIAIPCCSHDLAGARFRASPKSKYSKSLASQEEDDEDGEDALMKDMSLDEHVSRTKNDTSCVSNAESNRNTQAAETGSLKKTSNGAGQKKMPSAYASLCAYVACLAEDVGLEAEKEMLRIPSTRNECVLGRRRRDIGDQPQSFVSLASDSIDNDEDRETRANEVRRLVETELVLPLDRVRSDWIARAEIIAGKKGDGH